MNKTILPVLLLLGFCAGAEEFRFQDGSCECSGELKQAKDKAILDGLLMLDRSRWREWKDIVRRDGPLPAKSLLKKKIDEAERDCANARKEVKSLNQLYPAEFGKDQKPRLEDIELSCHLRIQSARFVLTNDINELKKSVSGRPFPEACREDVEALSSPAKIRAYHPKMTKIHCANNSDPAECQKSFDTAKAGMNPGDNQMMNILVYGWHNCVNEQFRNREVGQGISHRVEPYLKKMTCECDGD